MSKKRKSRGNFLPEEASFTTIVRNDVYVDENGTRFRVLDILQDTAWIFCLDEKKAFPKQQLYSTLMKRREKELIIIVKNNITSKSPICSDATNTRSKKAFDAISPLVTNKAIYDPAQRGPLITTRAKDTGFSKTTLYKYLRDYWAGGQTQEALRMNFSSISSSSISITNGRGRKCEEYETYQINEEDVKNIIEIINKYYIKNLTRTLTKAFDKLLELKYSYINESGELYIKPLGERPSIYQFRQIVKKHFPFADLEKKRKGEIDFNRENNHHLHGLQSALIGVGEQYEIDATIADIWLVARKSRKIIGKPTMYLIYDSYSRLCVGFYIGLENASWECAMQAILNISEDKRDLCKKYGYPYDPLDYPAHATFPTRFLGDLGEMICRNSNQICDGLHSSIVNAPPCSPQTKGIVECGFRLVHQQIAGTVPGYDPPRNARKRMGKHYDRDASLTVDDFSAIVFFAIQKHNKSLMKHYESPPDVILRTRPVPLELWQDSVAHQVGSLSRYNNDYLHLKLLPISEGVVTGYGISFKELYYSCPELANRGLFILAKNKGSTKISVSFDRRLVDSIIVYDQSNSEKFYECTLTGRSKDYKGYSFSEVHAVKFISKEYIRADKEDEQQRRVEFVMRTDAIVGPALEETQAVSRGQSRHSRKADIKDERAIEQSARRQNEGVMPNVSTNSNHASSEEDRPTTASNDDRTSAATSTIADTNASPRETIDQRLALKIEKIQHKLTK